MVPVVALALLGFGVATSSGAQADRPVIEITPGKVEAYRAAVQLFVDEATPPNPTRAADLRRVLQDALRFDGVLVPILDEAFLGPVATEELVEGKRYDCTDWTQSGADALVEGRIFKDGPLLAIEFAVWDTARCRRMDRRVLKRIPSEGPRLARHVADAVVEAFTGTPGAAATEMAFLSTRTGEREIFVMNADGSNPRSATRSRTLKAFPNWMPNGDGILYTAYHDNTQPALYLTARSRRVRPGRILRGLLPQAPMYRGVFDPEGESLAVVSSVDAAAEIFLVDREGRKVRRLTHNSAIDISPSWSPDGQRLAFVSDRSGSPQIYVVNRDGSGLRRLTYQGTYNTAPAWSPDGRWIAYETRLEAQFDIWLIDPQGEVNLPLIQHRRSDESPSWSPDGRKLAFSSNRRGRYDVFVADLAGENLRRLTQNAGENTHPVWGPFTR
ncbi:MAG: DPP IV N-terminal domain-containing protein [Myxococcota bacterium]